jgi:spore coat polysaccharide biosynthesis protein SpsF
MILGVIQARMNSERLPGKVLLPMENKPILWHIHKRLTFSKKLDKICISTSNNSSDDPIMEFAKKNNIEIFRGSEENLISRHLGAAKLFDAQVIVRITADDPLIDPKIIDDLISFYEQNPDADFICNNKERTFPVGLDVEIIPIKTLKKFEAKSNDSIFYEFFISNYIFEHPNQFKSIGMKLDKPLLERWTLDYPEDYEFIKEIYSHLYKKNSIFLMNDILNLLNKKPSLRRINLMHYTKFSHLKYKKLKNSHEKI